MATYIQPSAANATTLLDGELDGLASAGNAVSPSTFDNTLTDRYLFADFELFIDTQGSNRSATPRLDLYLEYVLDGTQETSTNSNAYAGSFIPSGTATTAQRLVLKRVPIEAMQFYARIVNQTGQALAASANTLKIKPIRLEVVEI